MKILWVLGGLFFVIGVGMLFAGVSWWRSNAAFAEHAVAGEGTVSDLLYRRSSSSSSSSSSRNSGTYVPVIDFTAPNGSRIHITGSSGSNPPAYSRGDKVPLLFDPENPEKAVIDSFGERKAGPLILSGLGAAFALVGGGVLFARARQRKQRAWLAQNGMRVQARLTGAMLDTSVAVNNRNPWRLSAQWQHPATQAVHTFRSDPIWFDPTPYVQRETVDVVLNADDPKQYVMDTSFLPKAG